jgi:3-oxoacyl-[acyl-carrier protein] reductase
MQVQQVVITGGGGSLADAMVDVMRKLQWNVAAPTRLELNVADKEAVNGYFENRPIDLLICAAGLTADAPLARLSEEAWDRVFAVNYQGAANCAAAALPMMLRQCSGHVIFISSHSALHPPKGQAAYATAKAALIGLNASLAQKYGRHKIRVNALLPGFLETRMTAAVTESRKIQILADHALGRLNNVMAVARFATFLHEHLPETSGQVFQLDSRPTRFA